MSTTLIIRNLDDTVATKLLLRAARHQNSMEAEIRRRIESVAGLWKDRGTTDELMELTLRDD